jgi:hypothetical protein
MSLEEGNANTRLFHLQDCHCGHINYIDLLIRTPRQCIGRGNSDRDGIFKHYDSILDNLEEHT